VLLIIFMVIVPTAARGLDAVIPQPAKSVTQTVEDTRPIVVQVLGDNERGVSYKINEVSFAKADVEAKLAEIFSVRSDKAMFIKGDAGVEFSAVAGVIDLGHQAGVERIGILTRQF
jgi:biopolymer transport protein ExbD/biopolymer transport protein TolR